MPDRSLDRREVCTCGNGGLPASHHLMWCQARGYPDDEDCSICGAPVGYAHDDSMHMAAPHRGGS